MSKEVMNIKNILCGLASTLQVSLRGVGLAIMLLLCVLLPGMTPTTVAAGNLITADEVLGRYKRLDLSAKVFNGWHEGSIVKDANGDLRWKNEAGASWKLILDAANKRLVTGTDNPYYAKYPRLREIKLVFEGDKLKGFDFNGIYTKMAAPTTPAPNTPTWRAHVDQAVNCRALGGGRYDCLASGPGCNTQTVPGQCSFPKAQAQQLCAAHGECRAITCNTAGPYCQARRTTTLAPWKGFTSYLRPTATPALGYPHCAAKIAWMKANWRSNPFYAQKGVNGSDASIRQYFSEVEKLCPPMTADGRVVHIRHGQSNYHLTQTYNGTRDDKRNVTVWPLAKNNGFRWVLQKTGDGYYVISNLASGLVLTQDGSGDERNVSNWGRLTPPTKRQQWRFLKGPDNFYQIVNRETGQGLSQTYGGTRDDKRNVTTWPGQTFANKGWSWRLEDSGRSDLVKLTIESVKAIKTSSGRDRGTSVLFAAVETAAFLALGPSTALGTAGKNAVNAGVTWGTSEAAKAVAKATITKEMVKKAAKDALVEAAIKKAALETGNHIADDEAWSLTELAFNKFYPGDPDELNILVNGVSIWPNGGRDHREIKSQQTHVMNTEYIFDRSKGLRIDLVEWDYGSDDDSLGYNVKSPGALGQPKRFEDVIIDGGSEKSLYEITYRIEPLGPTATNIGAAAAVQQAPITVAMTVAMVLGEYQHSPYQNDWHMGWIENDGAGGLRWRNKAGAKWRVIPDFANNRLKAEGNDNPYASQGLKEFKLTFDNRGKYQGFEFPLGQKYHKQ